VLKIQLFMTALVMTGVMYPVTVGFLPDTMAIVMVPRVVTSVNVYGCVLFGVWAGCIIGFITEYYTSHTYEPTREVAKSCEKCAANGIIYGVALGYLSSIIPVGLIAGAVFFCFKTTLRGGDWVAWHVVHASYVLEYRRLRPHRRQRRRRC
jgi:inorganic pyrophosphatase